MLGYFTVVRAFFSRWGVLIEGRDCCLCLEGECECDCCFLLIYFCVPISAYLLLGIYFCLSTLVYLLLFVYFCLFTSAYLLLCAYL